ncbi:MAG: methylenetetrahydrofolate reductase [Prevotellaceae bacterium]|jgi:methylenetetrahydrofolate reductase (NADPH)|nr:methylenetetrahydrofolate reductase [Prevotellaceae bacterium]
MKVHEIIRQSDKTLLTLELLPPVKGSNFDGIAATIESLIEFKPSYVNITYHRADIVTVTNSKGKTERYVTKKRPGTVSIAAAIKYKYNLEVVPHLVCGGFTKEETEDALIDLNFLSIQNVLALRGDKRKNDMHFVNEENGHAHAVDLLKQIKNMNNGIYLHSEIANAVPTDFSVGVAGYSEMHGDADSMEQDLAYLKQKADAGADYIVTQMFFDNAAFIRFVEQCRNMGITIPIIPGLKPISVKRQLEILPETFHLTIPEELRKEVEKCKDDKEVKQVGIEWTVAQCRELKKMNAPALHFYTMGKPDNIVKICKEIF